MGPGINLFKTLFPSEYYPYTANTLMSAKPTGKVIKDENDQTIETIVYSGNELRGLLKVGTNGLYADGDIDDGSGSTDINKGEYTFTGEENWSQYDTGFFACNFTAKNNSLGICEIYEFVVDKSYGNSPDNSMQIRGGKILIKDTSCANVSALITKITGKKFVYELATPTTAISTAWSNPIQAKQGGTETFVDGNFYGCVDLGSLDWDYYGGRFNTTSAISDVGGEISGDHYINAFCDIYTNSTDGTDKTFFIYSNKYLYIYNSEYTDATAFKNAMSGTYLFYEISTSTFELPTGHDTIYGTDMVVKKAEFGQTVYGGDYDAVSGILTSRYNSDGSQKATPDIIQIAPEIIMAMAGNNNVWNEAGNSEVKYVDLKGEGT